MKRKTMWAAIVLSMMALNITTGCSSDNDSQDQPFVVDPIVNELTNSDFELVSHSNDFAFNLFREVSASGTYGSFIDQPQSVVLSPISITYALGMLNNGAAGDTQAQITKVLGFGATGADSINAFCRKMLARAPRLDPLTKILISNTIYVNKGLGYELQDGFVQAIRTFYNAEPESRDFGDGKSMDVINQWAAEHTENMIQKVFNEQTFNEAAVSYLLNATYFKGNWAQQFDKAQTKDEWFDHAGMTKEGMTRPMMHQLATFEYAETDSYQALRLPYGNSSFVMTVLLPKESAARKVPTAEAWRQLNQHFDSTIVDVKLPRFETDADIDLVPVMKALGMSDAFTSMADFRYFCNVPVFVELMKQVAKIKVNEEGAEAAAVTIHGEATECIEPLHVLFHANHPFFYVISEQQTGAIFFIGRYTGY